MNGHIGYVQLVRPPTANAPHAFFAERNVRPIEPIAFNDAPDPVRSSDFNTRPSKMPKVVYTNIPGILSVMQDEFGYPLWAPEFPTASTYQAMGPNGLPDQGEAFVDRVNIQDPQSIPFGSIMMLPSTTDQVLFPMGDQL